MVRERQTEVLVVGAGPVGLFSAVILADRGVGLEIVDEAFRPATHGYALALHPRSLELLDSVGLAEQVISTGQRIERVAFYDRQGRRAELDLGTLNARFPFALALPQQELERVLAERLASRMVEVHWHHRVSAISVEGDQAVVTVDRLDRVSGGYPVATTHAVVVSSSAVRAGFVLGADGGRSTVRARLGADLETVGGPGMFGVFEVRAAFEPAHELRVVVDDRTASCLWPIGNQRWRWSFELEEPIQLPTRRPGESRPVVQIGDRDYPGLTADRLTDLLAERAPWFDAPVEEIYWALVVGFERRLASVLGRGPPVDRRRCRPHHPADRDAEHERRPGGGLPARRGHGRPPPRSHVRVDLRLLPARSGRGPSADDGCRGASGGRHHGRPVGCGTGVAPRGVHPRRGRRASSSCLDSSICGDQ